MIIPGSTCRSCHSLHRRYNLSRSTTGQAVRDCSGAGDGGGAIGFDSDDRGGGRGLPPPVPVGHFCEVTVQYGDGTHLTAVIVQDVLWLTANRSTGASAASYFDVMRIVEPPGVFAMSGVDGIWGLAYDSLAVNRRPTVLSSFVSKYSWDNVFGLYVGSEYDDPNGVLTLGGPDEAVYTGPILTTPVQHPSYYSVRITGLRVGDTAVPVAAPSQFGATFLDSG
eukprot:RCo024012